MNYTITNPKGIDKQIQIIQTFLHGKLGWVEDDIDVYGRVYKNQSATKGNVPEVYVGANEYRDAYINDAKTATICFIVNDNHTTENGYYFYNDMKIVVTVNLSKINEDALHRTDMEVEIEVLKQVLRHKIFVVSGIEQGLENVYKGFDISLIKNSNMHPYHTFAITGRLKYKINC